MLTAFKRRIIENGKVEGLQRVLREIIRLAEEQGIRFGELQIADSVRTVADVNVAKDDATRKEGKRPRHPLAPWGLKRSRRVRDEEGKVTSKPLYFCGYKSHVSINGETELITSVVATPGNPLDSRRMPSLVEQDLKQGLPVQVVAADRGYHDTRSH